MERTWTFVFTLLCCGAACSHEPASPANGTSMDTFSGTSGQSGSSGTSAPSGGGGGSAGNGGLGGAAPTNVPTAGTGGRAAQAAPRAQAGESGGLAGSGGTSGMNNAGTSGSDAGGGGNTGADTRRAHSRSRRATSAAATAAARHARDHRLRAGRRGRRALPALPLLRRHGVRHARSERAATTAPRRSRSPKRWRAAASSRCRWTYDNGAVALAERQGRSVSVRAANAAEPAGRWPARCRRSTARSASRPGATARARSWRTPPRTYDPRVRAVWATGYGGDATPAPAQPPARRERRSRHDQRHRGHAQPIRGLERGRVPRRRPRRVPARRRQRLDHRAPSDLACEARADHCWFDKHELPRRRAHARADLGRPGLGAALRARAQRRLARRNRPSPLIPGRATCHGFRCAPALGTGLRCAPWCVSTLRVAQERGNRRCAASTAALARAARHDARPRRAGTTRQ